MESDSQQTQQSLLEKTETLYREKRDADEKYQRQKAEYERLQKQLEGSSSQATMEKADLRSKQAILESQREELASKYE